MNRSLKNIAAEIFPPVLLRLLKPGVKYGWKGDFSNWNEAAEQCNGYNAANIVEKVKQAAIKVKKGDAAYERDSILFEKVQYSWPLLSSLMWIAAKNAGVLYVIDFGGSLGSSYFQNRKFFEGIRVRWNIVEQPGFVQLGNEFIADEKLQFFNSIKEAMDRNGSPNVLLISCALPYLEEPYEFLKEVMRLEIPHIIIDNTPFNFQNRDRITIQNVNPSIYKASYPCWLLNYNSVVSLIQTKYEIHTEYANELSISLDKHPVQYQGLLAILK